MDPSPILADPDVMADLDRLAKTIVRAECAALGLPACVAGDGAPCFDVPNEKRDPRSAVREAPLMFASDAANVGAGEVSQPVREVHDS